MKTIEYNGAVVRHLLRELESELSALNQRAGAKVDLRPAEVACLETLARLGPQSPSVLARLTQTHVATMTGLLDRLEAEGWVLRKRDAADRRAVVVHLVPKRARDLLQHYAGMNDSVEGIAASYDSAQLAVIGDFLQRLINAGKAANADLAEH